MNAEYRLAITEICCRITVNNMSTAMAHTTPSSTVTSCGVGRNTEDAALHWVSYVTGGDDSGSLDMTSVMGWRRFNTLSVSTVLKDAEIGSHHGANMFHQADGLTERVEVHERTATSISR
jgi:hypothetical protein